MGLNKNGILISMVHGPHLCKIGINGRLSQWRVEMQGVD